MYKYRIAYREQHSAQGSRIVTKVPLCRKFGYKLVKTPMQIRLKLTTVKLILTERIFFFFLIRRLINLFDRHQRQ